MEGGGIGGYRKRKAFGGSAEEEDREITKIPAMMFDGEVDEEDAAAEGKIMEIKEEEVVELMRWLEREISCPSVYYQAPAFITINGNEESCGPSFSDSASTVMASIDTRGGVSLSYFVGDSTVLAVPAMAGVGIWAGRTAGAEGMLPSADAPAGATVGESDGDWLADVMGGVAFELEEALL